MAEKDFWDKSKKRLREVSTAASDFIEEQTQIGRLKWEILQLNRKIHRLQQELGTHVYKLSAEAPKSSGFDNPDVIRTIAEIAELEKQIASKRDEIQSVQEQFRGASHTGDKKSTDPAAAKAAKPKSTAAKSGTNRVAASSNTSKAGSKSKPKSK